MSALLLPFLFLVVPALILLYMAAEIYFRNPQGDLHRLTVLKVLTYVMMFLGDFLSQVLPEDSAPLAVRYISLFAAFINMTAGLYFFQAFCKLRVHPILYHAGALLPLLGGFCLLLDVPWFKITVHSGSVWRSVEHSPGLNVLIFGMIIYNTICILAHLARAGRGLKSKPWIVQERKWISIFLWAVVLTISWVLLSQSLFKPLLRTYSYLNIDILTSYGVFIYVWLLRYAMVNYDFLSTVDRRYEILFNDSPIGIAIFNDDERLVDANPAYLRMIGIQDLSEKNWKNAKISDFISSENNEEFIRHFKPSFKDKSPLQIEFGMTNLLNEFYVVEIALNFFEAEGQILAFATVKDITVQKSSEQKLAYLAYHDPLTGLFNRRRFYENLEGELRRLEGTNNSLALLLIDLDQFKWINDTLGHSAGDELLRLVAARLLSVVPDNCFLARMGGDEFVVLMPGLQSESEAESLAIELNDKLREPCTIHDRSLQITASIGISLAPWDGADAETIIGSADAAMYGAKKEGRNQFLAFNPAQRAKAEKTLTLVNGLRSALENNEFSLHYQPQVDLRTGQLIGVEALLRWHSSELGQVSPNDFIPIAEENGAIIPIGEWVLRTAIMQGKQWIESGCPDLIMSVNVSARQLKEPQLAGRLAEMLREHDFPAGNLCLEITESSAIDNLEQSLQVCREIVGLGVSLALDDFGTGYSSLALLSRFPFRTVKIDKSLIREIETNPNDVDVIQTIVKLSGNLMIEVMAEGVETEWQLELLRRFGCHAVQGYLFGRPMPAGEFYASIEKQEEKFTSKYRTFEGIEVTGAAMLSMLNGIGAFRSVAIRFMEEGGFRVPESDQWYPMPEWLTIFKSMSETLGPEVLRQIGRATPENAIFPPDIDNIETALASIDIAYKMNHRGDEIEKIGNYAFSKTGDNSARIVCDNPYPCDFDRGIIESMVNKFKGSTSIVSIDHDECTCRNKNGATCAYQIKW